MFLISACLLFTLSKGAAAGGSQTPGRGSAFLPVITFVSAGDFGTCSCGACWGFERLIRAQDNIKKRFLKNKNFSVSVSLHDQRLMESVFMLLLCVCVCACDECVCVDTYMCRMVERGSWGGECDKELRMGFSDAFLLLGGDGGFLCGVIL